MNCSGHSSKAREADQRWLALYSSYEAYAEFLCNVQCNAICHLSEIIARSKEAGS